MLVACTLGRRFGIVSFSRSLEPWFSEIVAWHGMTGRCAAIRTLDESFQSINDVQEEKEAVLIDLALRTVKNDAADVVILAGAPLSGLANKIADRVPVPLVDGIQAATIMAEGLVRMQPRNAYGYQMLGRALHGVGRAAEARTAWQRALQLDPSDQRTKDLLAAP